MFGRLRVLSPKAGGEVAFGPGDRVRVGRLETESDLAVGDAFLAPAHFVVESGPSTCTVRDVSSGVRRHPECKGSCFLSRLRGTACPSTLCRVHDMSGGTGLYVNRQRVREAVLAHGDAIVAGTSCFVVDLGAEPMAAPAKGPAQPALAPEAQQATIDFAGRGAGGTTYALFDAARDPAALAAVRTSGELSYSLYDGAEGDQLEEVAPHLVQLRPRSRLLERMVRRDWGKSWFCLLGSTADFPALRRHLRRFLMIEDEATGKKMYFRFYDPRVLRAFLPTCTATDIAEFFGPVSWFLVESDDKASAVLFSPGQGGRLRRDVIAGPGP
jgi:pSer/pThr/pTyr-binding forkhead associated (FHA) protein